MACAFEVMVWHSMRQRCRDECQLAGSAHHALEEGGTMPHHYVAYAKQISDKPSACQIFGEAWGNTLDEAIQAVLMLG